MASPTDAFVKPPFQDTAVKRLIKRLRRIGGEPGDPHYKAIQWPESDFPQASFGDTQNLPGVVPRSLRDTETMAARPRSENIEDRRRDAGNKRLFTPGSPIIEDDGKQLSRLGQLADQLDGD